MSFTLSALAKIQWLSLKRFGRVLVEIGPLRSLFMLGLGSFILLSIVQQVLGGRHFLTLMVIPILQSWHLRRMDLRFLQSIPIPTMLILRIQYVIAALPFFAFQLYLKEWNYLLITLGFALIIPETRRTLSKVTKVQGRWQRFIPETYFEWRAGFRQYGLAVVFLLIASLTGSYLWVGIIPVAILLISFQIAFFYLKGEGKELIQVYGLGPSKLLVLKLVQSAKGHSLLVFPLAVSFLIFYGELWFILLYAWLVGIVVISNAIFYKYAMYKPGVNLENNNIMIGFSMICSFIPYLAPVPLVMCLVNARKALNTLKNYC